MFSQKHFNHRQIKCLDLLKHYKISVLYHLVKANVLVDALIRLSMGSVYHVEDEKK